MVMGNECAAGQFPIGTKGNPNNLTSAAPLMRQQFAPRNVDNSDPQNPKGICHLCSQRVMIKVNPPRRGFFVQHLSSQKGYKSFNDKRSGQPPRVRRDVK